MADEEKREAPGEAWLLSRKRWEREFELEV